MEITLLEWCVISLHPYASKQESMALTKDVSFDEDFNAYVLGYGRFYIHIREHTIYYGGGSVF